VFTYRHGTLDPLALLTFPVLPPQYRGRALQRADDPEFAKAPLGSGPYQYAGRDGEGAKAVARFVANPHHVRRGQPGPGPIREIHLRAWKDPGDPGKPPPHLLWDVPTDRLQALRKLGYEVSSLPTPRVYVLAINHRTAALAHAPVRRAIAAAIERQGLLDRHFRGDPGGKHHHPANGPFPHGSWAAAPQVPEPQYLPEQARLLARQAAKQAEAADWTLKYPADDPRVGKACEEMAKQITAQFAEAGAKVTVRAQALAPQALRQALERREYDLAYHRCERADEPHRLWELFDPHPVAVGPGGGNYLGYDSDDLQGLLRTALQHRNFPALQEAMHGVHTRLNNAMPLVPLWQLDTHAARLPALATPPPQPLSLFADVLEWKLTP
jgi:ABC-type transport system substrate-binding protein